MRNWKHWLEDRGSHRAPVDAHFREAVEWCKANGGPVLELGPGKQMDVRDALSATPGGVDLADLAPASPDVIDLAPSWNQVRQLPFGDNAYGAVMAREVMEHVDDIYVMTAEIHRVLVPGGRFWFSTPFIFALHDYETGDYWRLSDKAWIWLLRHSGFTSWEVQHARFLWDSWQYPASVLGWAEK